MKSWKQTTQTLLTAAALAAVSPVYASAPVATGIVSSAEVLATSGQILRAKAGAYGELFSGEEQLAPTTPVLALESAGAAGTTRLLVPGTGGAEAESAPLLLYAPRTDAATVIWQRVAAGKRHVDVATWRNGVWSEVATVMDDDEAVVFPAPPLTAVTRDAYDFAIEEGGTARTERQILHLLWRETTGAARYTALSFVDGAYVGWNDCLDLSATFLRGDAEGGAAVATPAALAALSLTPGGDERSVVIGFTNTATGRIGAVEVSALALELALLGDLVREEVNDAADLYDPADTHGFAGKIKGGIVVIGFNLQFHPGIVEFVAERVGGWLETAGDDYGYADFAELGDDTRSLAIQLTSSVSAALVEDPATGQDVLDIDLTGFLAELEGESQLNAFFDLKVRSDLPLPALTGVAGQVRLYPSRSGRDLLLAWENAAHDRIFYVESRSYLEGGAWSAPQSLVLGTSLDAGAAHHLLGEKIQ